MPSDGEELKDQLLAVLASPDHRGPTVFRLTTCLGAEAGTAASVLDVDLVNGVGRMTTQTAEWLFSGPRCWTRVFGAPGWHASTGNVEQHLDNAAQFLDPLKLEELVGHPEAVTGVVSHEGARVLEVALGDPGQFVVTVDPATGWVLAASIRSQRRRDLVFDFRFSRFDVPVEVAVPPPA
ncbi:MAG: hypothetical protein QOJ92_2805 [Frankiales bacterium]|nr:hypothetical protein [Frankiales bacterium]